MKIKILMLANLYFLFFSCENPKTNIPKSWKTIDLRSFSIVVPASWIFQPQQGEDSFVGILRIPSGGLNFDYSNMGYANGLFLSENEYLAMQQYTLRYHPLDPISDEDGLVSSGFQGLFLGRSVKNQIPLFKNNCDTSVIIFKPSVIEAKTYPETEYLAKVSIRKNLRYIPIKLPVVIKTHIIIVDTVGSYIRKLIYPKTTGKGLTGVYFKKLQSDFNFEMSGSNLSAKDQGDAIQAFKSIKFPI